MLKGGRGFVRVAGGAFLGPCRVLGWWCIVVLWYVVVWCGGVVWCGCVLWWCGVWWCVGKGGGERMSEGRGDGWVLVVGGGVGCGAEWWGVGCLALALGHLSPMHNHPSSSSPDNSRSVAAANLVKCGLCKN